MATQHDDERDMARLWRVHLGSPSRAHAARTATVRRITRAVAALTAFALVGTLAIAIPAAADPAGDGTMTLQPSTALEAKDAWLKASQEAEAANEELLQARSDEQHALRDLSDARIGVMQAKITASSAQSVSVQAASEYEAIRGQLAEFASASFRGADLGELAAAFTSDSTSEFLDKISSLDQVAGSTRLLMIQAMEARTAAQDAADKADQAESAAVVAQNRADAALTAAEDATAEVKKRKKKLDGQVETYHRLFSALTGQERAAAMQAQQDQWERLALEAEEQQRLADEAAADLADDTPAESEDGDEAETPSSSVNTDQRDESNADKARAKASKAVAAALSKLGAPYVYGSSGPSTFDCSGLTSWAWAQAGVTIPRTSSGQAGLKTVPLDKLEPGDLVTYYSPVHHVAMYIGNGQIIHASTEGKPVFITSVYRGGPYPTGHRVNY